MTDVGKTATGTTHVNTVVLKKIKVFFQRFAGTAGTDAERGISGVDYTFKVDGKVASTGKTAADGSVSLDVPAGSKAVLSIFDTDYPIKIVSALEAVDTKKGKQRRLSLLGYELGDVDGDLQAKTDNAALNFQADNAPLDTDGDIGTKTKAQLKSQFGE